MGTFREAREVEREVAKDYGFDADRMVEVDEGTLELRDMTRESRMETDPVRDIPSPYNGV